MIFMLLLKGCRMATENPVRQFDKVSMTAYAQLCAGEIVPISILSCGYK
jgi:hypothetical protein